MEQALADHVTDLRSRQHREKEAQSVASTVTVLKVGAVIVAAIVVALVVIGPTTCPRHAGKIIAAQGVVKERLASPATATFPWNEYKVAEDDKGYAVGGYVDSQNQFGAMIRTWWVVQMKRTDTGWELVECSID